MRHHSPLFLILVICAGFSAQAQTTPLDTAALLRRMIDLDRLSRPPAAGERSVCFSSFDRRQQEVRDGRYANWDADNDQNQFLRTTADGWQVLAEASQPGVITRIWCDGPAGRLRVVLDGTEALACDLVDVFRGAQAPFGAPLSHFALDERGATCQFPIGFAKSCLILTQGFQGEYQIDATLFSPGTAVRAFSSELDDAAKAALQEVAQCWARGYSDKQLFGGRRTSVVAMQEDIQPGATLGTESDAPGTVRALYVALTDRAAPRDVYALRTLILRVYWDGSPYPGIEAPLCDFFGAGFTRSAYRGLVAGTDLWTELPAENLLEAWQMYCYLPMPFRQQARIEIENTGRQKIGVFVQLRIERDPPAADAMYLRARFRRESPCKTFDYPLLKADGPGRLVGVVLSVDTPRADWWGRGDHKAWIDAAEGLPSLFGTSTSGLFGNLGGGLAAVSTPTQGVTLTGPYGKSSAYRWLVGDSVPFSQNLRLTIENWQDGQAQDVDYSSVAFWYSSSTGENTGLLKAADVAPLGLRIPGAIEAEGVIRGENWGSLMAERNAGGVELSGGAAALQTAPESAMVLSVAQAGTYQVTLRTHPRRSFGTVEVVRDGVVLVRAAYNREAGGVYELGSINLRAGENKLGVRVSAPTVLDCWVLTPEKE